MDDYMKTCDAKPIVFCIHPFSDDFQKLYSELRDRFKSDYLFVNALDMDNPRSVLRDIVEGIYGAKVVIADLTGSNPNVYYELGLAHALGKKTIILTQAIDELPFDIRAYRVIEYSFNFWAIDSLSDELNKMLAGAVDGSIKFGNPVSDYIPEIEECVLASNEDLVDLKLPDGEENAESSADEGYLDMLSNIQESADAFQGEFREMAKDQNELNTKIQSATDEINRVKTHAGAHGPLLARNICRRLAVDLDRYATNFGLHLSHIDESWSVIEDGMLSLLESKYVENERGREDLCSGVTQLMKIDAQIDACNDIMQNFSDEMKQLKGIEKNLTKAIDKLSLQVAKYVALTKSMQSSLQRIRARVQLMDGGVLLPESE
ncbi:hypothetical protein H6A14_02675 [Bifidobacterium pullorum subsp. saeculare]|uniref:hypothetical protein n=1 Tax=Bifidobacterium pullorum TaxID=78448 RepID=UPI001956EF64|nr:hypothetical protein [Bifidobacterium pullorum]MBM6730094.1 hypothetical protein [Bifidobacterium pullorum subsp. saeculare]